MGVRNDGTAWAAVGSANLTERGAHGNVELLATVSGDADHSFFRDLTDWLEEIQSYALALTPELLCALDQAREAYQVPTDLSHNQLGAALQNLDGPFMSARDIVARLHHEALLTYIQTTKLFASYKLVILGLLLKDPHGRQSLTDLARQFKAYYVYLQAAGVQPERSSGNPPPRMLDPNRPLDEVMRILSEAPREAFLNTGSVVRFGIHGGVEEVLITRSLWNATTHQARHDAYTAVCRRLEAYYQQYAGTDRCVVGALDEASRE